MDKNTLLRDIRAGHASIATALAALDDEALLDPAPGMEGWTRKDVVAHIEWWHEHTSNVIEGIRTGVDPYPGDDESWDTDAWNARILAENRERTAADVRAGEAASFTRLVGLVEGVTEDELFREDPQPWLDGTLAQTVISDSSSTTRSTSRTSADAGRRALGRRRPDRCESPSAHRSSRGTPLTADARPGDARPPPCPWRGSTVGPKERRDPLSGAPSARRQLQVR